MSLSIGECANTEGAHDPKGFGGEVPFGISIILMIAIFALGPLVISLGFRQRGMGLGRRSMDRFESSCYSALPLGWAAKSVIESPVGGAGYGLQDGFYLQTRR